MDTKQERPVAAPDMVELSAEDMDQVGGGMETLEIIA